MKWTKRTEICGSCCHRPINHSILDVCQSIHTNALEFVIKFCSLGTNIQVYMYFVVPDDNFNDYLRMQSHVTKDGNPARIPPLVEQVGQYVLCTTFSVHQPLGTALFIACNFSSTYCIL